MGGVRCSTRDVCSVCLYNFYTKPFATTARNLLYNSYHSSNILIGKIDGCITHLIFLHDLYQLQKTCTNMKQQHLPPHCTSLHSVFEATTSLPQEPCHHSPPSPQMDPKWWKSGGAISGLNGGGRRTVHPNFVIASCISKLVFGHVSSC